MVLPCASVMVIIVLLKVELTCATPDTMFLRSRRRTRPAASLAIFRSFKRARHAGRWGNYDPRRAKAAGTGEIDRPEAVSDPVRVTSSCRRSAWTCPCEYGHWYGSVGRAPAGCGDGADPDRRRGPSTA